ncbi:MAG: TetR/AcrR family transcriptional regulator [Roseivirga sp.]|jgi:AcrR family transcriptional regulator
MSKKDFNARESILNAAVEIFQSKGFAGSRMQEIADKAGINKALLHYYFRNKQLLFEAVFKSALGQLVPEVSRIFNADISISEKITQFVAHYIPFVSKNRFLPVFILQELNNNPAFADKFFSNNSLPHIAKFKEQVLAATQDGEIRKLDPDQFIIDMFSMVVFPFVGRPMMMNLLQKDDRSFDDLIQNRIEHATKVLLNSIKK